MPAFLFALLFYLSSNKSHNSSWNMTVSSVAETKIADDEVIGAQSATLILYSVVVGHDSRLLDTSAIIALTTCCVSNKSCHDSRLLDTSAIIPLTTCCVSNISTTYTLQSTLSSLSLSVSLLLSSEKVS